MSLSHTIEGAMQARPDVMLLAAGLGRRMLPLTAHTPKPLLRVGGMALIDHVIEAARAEGCTRFVVNAHHHAGQVLEHVAGVAAEFPALSFQVSHEFETLLETGGGLKKALPLLEGDPILAMNADAFWPVGADAPIARMLERFAEGRADIVLLCVHPHRAIGFRRSHDFCLDPRGRVTRDAGAPVVYAGVALIARSALADTPDGPFSLNLVFDRALEAGRLAGVPLMAPWLHVGDPEAMLEAGRALADLNP
ncbi:nucleotidyltransferase family protein [Arsenicitalea aurantiaca]|uniref:Nucleotidyltransferase family protein n=1 Tax=Arsenicitalea aurantiaca TaxID=1783274 RepID=A0A433X896_9HYPH|nr:nucleotidyltransferase family protein [Arsenicitalea aurantiaca]RUT30317.1 nucleotidyltransferase family protein [Arsenicitalea aurantiaca]